MLLGAYVVLGGTEELFIGVVVDGRLVDVVVVVDDALRVVVIIVVRKVLVLTLGSHVQ